MGSVPRITLSLAAVCWLIPLSMTVRVGHQSAERGDEPRSGDWRAYPANEWPTVGGDWNNSHHSVLTQVNPGNVAQLNGAWVTDLDSSSRATPVVQDGMIFTTSASRLYALDAKSGEVVWSYLPERGVPRRGVAIGEGLVFTGLGDGRVIALNARTGALVWTGAIQEGPSARQGAISGTLVYAEGLVFAGLTGETPRDSWGIRARLVAFDAATGNEAWRFYVIPAPGEPGSETWPDDIDPSRLGGGGIWQPPAVDPDLGLVYFGVGNAVPQWGGELRAGDNLFNSSVVALDLRTGKLRWYYQLVHHDIWDMDQVTPLVLYTATVDGRPRKALAAMRTDGYLFFLDRETGTPLFPVEERPVKQDLRQKTAPTQPFPVNADRVGPDCLDPASVPSGFSPDCWFNPWYYDRPNVASVGMIARLAAMSYDPEPGYFYVMGGSTPWWFRRTPNPYYYHTMMVPLGKKSGSLTAVDSRTNKIVWQKQTSWELSNGSGFLSTASGLLFHLDADGSFQAHRAKTGEPQWQFQTGSSAATLGGAPISYELDGQQYIAVQSGRSLWALTLAGRIGPRPAAPPPPTETPLSGAIENLPSDGTGEIAVAALLEFGGEHQQDEYAIKPTRAGVDVGTTVKWLNYGIVVHSIEARDGSWSTGPIRPGQTGTVTFERPGTYIYVCTDHPWSIAELVVRGPAESRNARAGVYTADQAARGRGSVRRELCRLPPR